MKTVSAVQQLENSHLSVSFKQLSESEIEITTLDHIRNDFHQPDFESETLCVVSFNESKYVTGISIDHQHYNVVNPEYYGNYPSFLDI